MLHHNMITLFSCLKILCRLSIFFFFLSFFAISWAAPVTYVGSQARGRIGAVAWEPSHSGIRATSATYTTAHDNARSLTH